MLRISYRCFSSLRGIHAPRALSPELARFMRKERAAWTEVISSVWAHVKSKGLQNPDRKRYICPDNELSPFLGQDEFEMFQLGGKLKHHIISKKVEEESAKGQEPPEENEPREKLSTDLSQSDELTQQTEIPTESETPAQTYAETSDESIRAPRSDWPPSC